MNPDLSASTVTEGVSSLSRRTLFKGVGCLLAAAALPAPRLAAQESEGGDAGPPPDPSIIDGLTEYMVAAGEKELPPEVAEQIKFHILDTIAAQVSGADLPPAKIAFKWAHAAATNEGCTVSGSQLLCPPADAALVNGMLAHSDETDDSHAPSHCHPGCATVSAALVAGEFFNISGARLLRAVALGYDVGTRATLTLGGLNWQMKTHRGTHNIASNFGAGASAACAAGLNQKQMAYAIDYAAQQSGGSAAWMRDEQHISKALVFGGRPARNGVTSAIMIRDGATGVSDILSGQDNFFLAQSPGCDPKKMIAGLGQKYEIMRTSIKKWTVGSPIQAPLDAIENMRKKHPFEGSDVKAATVRIATSEAKTVNNREMPDISVQHMMAVMLMDKTASFKAAHDVPRVKDPATMAMRARVTLIPDEALEKLYPERQSIVEVTLNDGTVLTEKVTAVRGTPKNPMTREDITEKTHDLMAPFLGDAQATALINKIFDLENLDSVRSLRPLLQRAAT
jgi:2-methylcitrate dehydratase PrpD